MTERRKWWEVIADISRAQMEARIAGDPELEQWIGGTGPDGKGCVYAARSQEHAVMIHERRMAVLIRSRQADDDDDPPPPHRDNPYCPSCAAPCGTTEDCWSTADDLVACAHCGYMWHSTEDRRRAERADAAYSNMLTCVAGDQPSCRVEACSRSRELTSSSSGPSLTSSRSRCASSSRWTA